jgi:hypothetical protein
LEKTACNISLSTGLILTLSALGFICMKGGQEIARYAATSVDRQLPIMEKRLDFQLDDKIDIIVLQ